MNVVRRTFGSILDRRPPSGHCRSVAKAARQLLTLSRFSTR
jgi:hypothetical protein